MLKEIDKALRSEIAEISLMPNRFGLLMPLGGLAPKTLTPILSAMRFGKRNLR